MLRPLLLAADNFTPPMRTPWGGRNIIGRYKRALPNCSRFAEQAVGESWELSLGPELPSTLEDGTSLRSVLQNHARAQLGAEAERGGSALLVKLIDAAENLSVQIHPDVDDPTLSTGETGKPEAWYVLAREPGAGIYLGLQPGVDEASMRSALASGADVSKLLVFVSVEPGDFFLLTPGLPHAIGRGLTLLEPQYVMPGKRAVTFRYWDWNRRYDAHGKLDLHGAARELHVERALSVTRFRDASDARLLASLRTSLAAHPPAQQVAVELLSGPETPARVRSEHLRVAAIRGTGNATLPAWDVLRALTVVAGELTLKGAFGELTVGAGRTAAIGAGLGALHFEARSAHALLAGAVA
jgi:mannose-6-phosphate isomerase class I